MHFSSFGTHNVQREHKKKGHLCCSIKNVTSQAALKLIACTITFVLNLNLFELVWLF